MKFLRKLKLYKTDRFQVLKAFIYYLSAFVSYVQWKEEIIKFFYCYNEFCVFSEYFI